MSRFSNLLRGAIGLGAIGIAACGDADKMVLGPVTPTGGSMFKTYVAVGNSLTAGMQSGGLNDSTQRAAFPVLFATQAGARFAYPSFPKSFSVPSGTATLTIQSGCPAPLGNWVSQKNVDSLVPTPSGCDLRDASRSTDILNNVGVPGAYAADLTTTGSGTILPGNGLQTLILGGRSQVDAAIQADPTFVSFWIGNNETLYPASVGMMAGLAGAAPPLIPASVEIPAIKKALDALVAGSPHLQGGIIFGAVRVVNAPRFFLLDSLKSATKKTAFDGFTGKPSTILPNCAASAGWYVSSELAKAVRAYPASGVNPPPGSHPPLISCGSAAPLAPAPVGDIFLLDPTEVATLNATTDAYNAYLKAKADTLKWIYVDPNVLLASLRSGTTPSAPAFPNFTSNTRDAATAVFGINFSLDGVHPSAAGQKLVANLMIDSVNARYGTKILKVP